MGYITDSILNDPAPADALIADLEAEMTAEGWVFVEEVVVTYPYRVWRSPAANNSFGLDWHLTIRKLSDDRVDFGVSEGYDSSSNEVIAFCPTPTTSYGTFEDGTVRVSGSAPARSPVQSFFFNSMTGLNTVECRYWALVTPENVIVQADSTHIYECEYAGFFDPIKTGITNNVTLGNFQPSRLNSGSISRLAERAGAASGDDDDYEANINTIATSELLNHAAPESVHPLHDYTVVGRWLVQHLGTGSADDFEKIRGFARHLRYVPYGSSSQVGDTLTDGVDTYVALYPSSTIWLKTTNIGTP